MQSEIRKEIKPHDIILKSRKKVELTGIKKISSLNENEFILETTLGKVLISGDSLTMLNLELEKGNLEITGNIDKIEYLSTEQTKEKKGIFSKLFK